MNRKDELFVNQYIQRIITKEDVEYWFNSFEENGKQENLRDLWYMCTQARILIDDIIPAAKSAQLKATHTSVIMLMTGKEKFQNRGFRLSLLKGKELTQAFNLLLEMLAIADVRRRKNEDPTKCTHWWHKDLSDPDNIKDILENY